MVDAMLFFSTHQENYLNRTTGLPRYLAFLLLSWLTISGLIVSSASADDTIIVIPTVNGDVQNHAALTVGSRLSRSGFRVTAADPLIQRLNIGPIVKRGDVLTRGKDIITAVGKAIITSWLTLKLLRLAVTQPVLISA